MKLVNMKKRNSESYIGSADTQCVGDMMQIEEIRGIVTYLNKQLRESNAVDRINGDVYGGIANSKRIDIYIHQRRKW
jgi:hypothetical protein